MASVYLYDPILGIKTFLPPEGPEISSDRCMIMNEDTCMHACILACSPRMCVHSVCLWLLKRTDASARVTYLCKLEHVLFSQRCAAQHSSQTALGRRGILAWILALLPSAITGRDATIRDLRPGKYPLPPSPPQPHSPHSTSALQPTPIRAPGSSPHTIHTRNFL